MTIADLVFHIHHGAKRPRRLVVKSLAETNVIVVFRSRLRDDADLIALASAGERMYELASQMPGFLSYKDFAAEDGESTSIVEFSDMDSLLAWRNHPEHLAVQQRGREEFFAAYEIHVCKPLRSYAFDGKR
jgi:heme-degrading monooxygenase HmoA